MRCTFPFVLGARCCCCCPRPTTTPKPLLLFAKSINHRSPRLVCTGCQRVSFELSQVGKINNFNASPWPLGPLDLSKINSLHTFFFMPSASRTRFGDSSLQQLVGLLLYNHGPYPNLGREPSSPLRGRLEKQKGKDLPAAQGPPQDEPNQEISVTPVAFEYFCFTRFEIYRGQEVCSVSLLLL